MDIIEHRAEVAGIETFWRQAGDAPILYVHGNPNNSDLWLPFLERTGGVAMDLPGFGRSAKPANFDYSIEGYGSWLDAFRRELGWDRCRMLAHDWGAVGLTLGDRLERSSSSTRSRSCRGTSGTGSRASGGRRCSESCSRDRRRSGA